MLENCLTAKQRWGGVNNLIDQWLEERQKLLVEFCFLADQPIFDESNNKHTSRLKNLCQLLVDYCSAGHFEIYNQLINEGKFFNDEQGIAESSKLIEDINPTTDVILDFNDKYQETDDLSSLVSDLSTLGIALEARFEAEDALIKLLHSGHA